MYVYQSTYKFNRYTFIDHLALIMILNKRNKLSTQ